MLFRSGVIPIDISARIIETEGNIFVQFIIRDISEKKKNEAVIWTQANFDAVTGLPNRRMFMEHLSMEIRKSQRTQMPLALMFIDMDRFKDVNDTMGHDMGDILLQQAGERLQFCVRETDTVARLGGDEVWHYLYGQHFGILLPILTIGCITQFKMVRSSTKIRISRSTSVGRHSYPLLIKSFQAI